MMQGAPCQRAALQKVTPGAGTSGQGRAVPVMNGFCRGFAASDSGRLAGAMRQGSSRSRSPLSISAAKDVFHAKAAAVGDAVGRYDPPVE